MPHISRVRANPSRFIPSGFAVTILLAGIVAVARATSGESPSPVDTTHSERHFETTPDASQDSIRAIFEGAGANPGLAPIVRMGPLGQEIKEVGSSVWKLSVRKSEAELQAEVRARSREKVRRMGTMPMEIALVAQDSVEIRLLKTLGDTLRCEPPCTLRVVTTLRHFSDLRDAGISCWQWRPPTDAREKERGSAGKLDLGPAVTPERAIQPIGTSAPPMSPSAPGDSSKGLQDGRRGALFTPLSPSVTTATIFTEGFETSTVPGSIWSSVDYNPNSGTDYWGDQSSSCALVHGGSWSVGAAGHSDVACRGYDNDQSANFQNINPIDLSGYQSFLVTFWINYATETNYDYLRWYAGSLSDLSLPEAAFTGSSGGWVPVQLTFINTSHTYDQFYLRFQFESDYSVTAYGGVYIDDIQITGTPFPKPNLTYTTPAGWSGPIVPSMSFGTTTTGANLLTGQFTNIDWAIRNADTGSAGGFSVDYYLDNGWIGSDYVSSLAGNTTYTRTDWGYVVNTAGSHTLKMVIDPTGSVAESNEGDNSYQATFTWSNPPAPDLIVQNVTVTAQTPPAAPASAPSLLETGSATAYTFTMGQTIDIAVTVKNQGTATTGGSCALDWYKSRGSPPPYGTRGEQSATVGTLAAGASAVLHFYATGSKAETWSMFLLADATNAVNEGGAEGNNVGGPVQMVWAAKSIYITGTFFYDDSLSGTTTTTPCNDVMVLDEMDTGAGAGTDTLGAAAVCCNDTGRFIIGPIANEDADQDHGFLDLKVRVNYRSNEACWRTGYPNNWLVTMLKADGTPWSFDSSIHSDFSGDTLDVGLLKPTSYGDRWALHMMRTVIDRGWSYMRNVVAPPESIKGVFVQWAPQFPGKDEQTVWANPDTIKVFGGIDASGLAPDEWDDDILMHEYGHHVAFWERFGSDLFPADDNLKHYLEEAAPSLNTAWLEGWAHYFAAATRPNVEGRLVNTGRTTTGLFRRKDFLLEGDSVVYYKTLPQPNWSPGDRDTVFHLNENGPQWEASVAGTLWDIYDSRHDNPNGDAFADSLSDGFLNLYAAMHQSGTDRVGDIFDARLYYDSLAAHPATNIRKFGLSQRVFLEHGIMGGPILTGADAVALAPAAFPRILGVYPNPFNPLVRIKFVLPAAPAGKPASLRVYNVQGRLLRTLAAGPLKAGRHEAVWDGKTDDGTEVGSGVYFCRLESGRNGASAKLTLLR